ncbi:MAG: hypothetical protein ACKUBY_00285 [Candidatus Moraniibacteriota bacterium]
MANKITKLTGLNNFQISSLCMLLAIPVMYIGSTSAYYILKISGVTPLQVAQINITFTIIILFFTLMVVATNWITERSHNKGDDFLLGSAPIYRYMWLFTSIFGAMMTIAIWCLCKEFSLVHYFFTVLTITFAIAMYFTHCNNYFIDEV